MDRKGRRLAKVLSRVLAVLLGIGAVGLALLVPATLFAFARPGMLAGDYVARVNGVAVDPAQPGLAGTVLLTGCIYLAIMLVVFAGLRGMMKTVSAGEPFVLANVTRLRRIAGAMAGLLIGEVLIGLLLPTPLREAGAIGAGFNGGLFLGLLTVLVLAEVFREGVRLREDAEGTV